MQAFITVALTPFVGLPLAAAAGAAASTAAFGGSSREIGINAGIAFVTAGIFSRFGANADTGQLTTFGKGMIGLSIVGGLAYAATTDGWAGVENFAGSIAGAYVGAYAGSVVSSGTQGFLKDPAKAGGDSSGKKLTASEITQKVNTQKGDPQAVADGAKQIAQKAADTRTVISEEMVIYKETLAPTFKNPAEILIEGSSSMSGDQTLTLWEWGVARVDVIRATKALTVVPENYVRTGTIVNSDSGIGIIGTAQYRMETKTYLYGPEDSNILIIKK